jgi:hypothetical protein
VTTKPNLRTRLQHTLPKNSELAMIAKSSTHTY